MTVTALDLELALAAPAEAVWRHLREPALVRRWFGWEHDGLEREIEQIFVDAAEADEDARAVQWMHDPEQVDRFEVRPDGASGSVLRVTRSTPEPGGDPVTEGWITFAQQLRFALARHAGEERRTLLLSGAAKRGALPIARTFGLGAAADADAGARYEATVGPGDAVTGEAWYRTERQLGVTVDQLGDALLVVTEMPPDSASAIVSAYGPDAATRLDGVEERWRAWWAAAVAA